MSADNWTICPKCKLKHESDFAKKREKVRESYGKIPSNLFIASMEAVKEPPKLEETLREDYCQGMSDDGTYLCSYGCSCDKCGFSFSFKHTENPPTK